MNANHFSKKTCFSSGLIWLPYHTGGGSQAAPQHRIVASKWLCGCTVSNASHIYGTLFGRKSVVPFVIMQQPEGGGWDKKARNGFMSCGPCANPWSGIMTWPPGYPDHQRNAHTCQKRGSCLGHRSNVSLSKWDPTQALLTKFRESLAVIFMKYGGDKSLPTKVRLLS